MKLLVTSMLHAMTTTYVTQENKNQNPKNRKLCLFKGLHILYLTGFSLTMNPCYYCCRSLKNLQHSFILCCLSFANGSPYFNITSGSILISFLFNT